MEDNKSLIDIFFITSIDKSFYKERNIEFICSKNKNSNSIEFSHKEIFTEEIQKDKIIYSNKLNNVSFELSSNQPLNNNSIILKIKDGSKIYLYDCNMEYDYKNMANRKAIFIYNFEIGELRQDKGIQ